MAADQPILAIDPGRNKCGLAVVFQGKTLLQEIVDRANILQRIADVLPSTGAIVVGDRTGSKDFIAELKAANPTIVSRITTIDEHLSSVEARSLYWQVNPPKGIKRLIPTSLQEPPVPIDDFVAVILAQRFIDSKK